LSLLAISTSPPAGQPSRVEEKLRLNLRGFHDHHAISMRYINERLPDGIASLFADISFNDGNGQSLNKSLLFVETKT
jgi:hypothetical protein